MGCTVIVHTDYCKKENIESALDTISTIVSKAMERQVMQNEVISTSGRSIETNRVFQ